MVVSIDATDVNKSVAGTMSILVGTLPTSLGEEPVCIKPGSLDLHDLVKESNRSDRNCVR